MQRPSGSDESGRRTGPARPGARLFRDIPAAWQARVLSPTVDSTRMTPGKCVGHMPVQTFQDDTSTLFEPVEPWPLPRREDCFFYHDLDLPGGTTIGGHWDIRGHFDQYIGNQTLNGKKVLDVGTASGFLAFGAEQGG